MYFEIKLIWKSIRKISYPSQTKINITSSINYKNLLSYFCKTCPFLDNLDIFFLITMHKKEMFGP